MRCRCAIKHGNTFGLRHCLKFSQRATSVNLMIYDENTYLPTIEKILCFKYYGYLLYILYFVSALYYDEISSDCSLFSEFVEGISMQPKIIRSQNHNFPKTYTDQSFLY